MLWGVSKKAKTMTKVLQVDRRSVKASVNYSDVLVLETHQTGSSFPLLWEWSWVYRSQLGAPTHPLVKSYLRKPEVCELG